MHEYVCIWPGHAVIPLHYLWDEKIWKSLYIACKCVCCLHSPVTNIKCDREQSTQHAVIVNTCLFWRLCAKPLMVWQRLDIVSSWIISVSVRLEMSTSFHFSPWSPSVVCLGVISNCLRTSFTFPYNFFCIIFPKSWGDVHLIKNVFAV